MRATTGAENLSARSADVQPCAVGVDVMDGVSEAIHHGGTADTEKAASSSPCPPCLRGSHFSSSPPPGRGQRQVGGLYHLALRPSRAPVQGKECKNLRRGSSRISRIDADRSR